VFVSEDFHSEEEREEEKKKKKKKYVLFLWMDSLPVKARRIGILSEESLKSLLLFI